jgi:hypothetical protein
MIASKQSLVLAGEGFALRHRQTVWLVMHTLDDQPR